MQPILAEQMLGHFPSDEEFMEWIEIYGKKVNVYFYTNPYTNEDELGKVLAYLTISQASKH